MSGGAGSSDQNQSNSRITEGTAGALGGNQSILSFPFNTAQNSKINNSASDISTNMAQVSVVKNIIQNNLRHTHNNTNQSQIQPAILQNSHILIDNNSNVFLMKQSQNEKSANNSHVHHKGGMSSSNRRNKKSQRTASVMTASTILDEDSAFFDEKPKVNLINFNSNGQQQKLVNNPCQINQPLQPRLFIQQQHVAKVIQRAPQMRGDEDDDLALQQNSFSNVPLIPQNPIDVDPELLQSFELIDPKTKEVVIRTSLQEAKRHLRKISQMIEKDEMIKASIINQQQLDQNQSPSCVGVSVAAGGVNSMMLKNNQSGIEQGNTEDSEVPPDTERDTIAGQRISIIKSILQKMLMMQQSSQQMIKQQQSSPRITNKSLSTIPQWSREEMVALTEIFKNIVYTEIENKQTTAMTKCTNNSLIIDRNSNSNNRDSDLIAQQNIKMTQLEKQNERLAREVLELRMKLQQTSSSQYSQLNDENQQCLDNFSSNSRFQHNISSQESNGKQSDFKKSTQNLSCTRKTKNKSYQMKSEDINRAGLNHQSRNKGKQVLMTTIDKTQQNFDSTLRSHRQTQQTIKTKVQDNIQLNSGKLDYLKSGILTIQNSQYNSQKLTKTNTTVANSSRGSFVNNNVNNNLMGFNQSVATAATATANEDVVNNMKQISNPINSFKRLQGNKVSNTTINSQKNSTKKIKKKLMNSSNCGSLAINSNLNNTINPIASNFNATQKVSSFLRQ